MATEGKLYLDAYWNGTTLTASSIRSCRPLRASSLMINKPVQDAVDTLPLLFSLCGRAHGVAAAMAVEAAAGTEVNAAVRRARKRLVIGEMLQEYLWRILFDWPAYMGGEPQVGFLAAMRQHIDHVAKPLLASGGWKAVGGGPVAETGEAWKALLRALNELLGPHVLARNPARWLELDTQEDFHAWLSESNTMAAGFLRSRYATAQFGASDVALMASPDEAWLRQAAQAMDNDAEFSQRPHWNGAALETGAMARQAQHPLLRELAAWEGNSVFVRMLARLIELASLAAGKGNAAPWGGALPLGEGEGMAWVETARGLLLHRVTIDGERVLSYRIVAPTEWNFHPQGALIRGLAGTPAASMEAARSRAEWLVQSLDPCVACEITVHRS